MRRIAESFQKLVELMDALRGEKGCPWDKEQTLDSLKPFLIEEAYEVIEAIEQGVPDKLKEELGDLLFHILFISKVSDEMGGFDIADVIDAEHRKMTRRHPHVFGSRSVAPEAPREDSTAPDKPLEDGAALGNVTSPKSAHVLKQWYETKREERHEKGITSMMDGIPHHLPALQYAQKVQRRAAQVGFDWEKPGDVLGKILEELQEVSVATGRGDPEELAEELGDLLFSVVNICRFLRVDAEGALRRTIRKFTGRFRAMERQAAADGATLGELSLEEMDRLWDSIKAKEKRDLPGNPDRRCRDA